MMYSNVMKLNDLLQLKPGILFKGINNAKKQSILSLDKWTNDAVGLYGIRWFDDETIQAKQFLKFDHRKTKFEERLLIADDWFDNLKVPSIKHNSILFDYMHDTFTYKELQIGQPIGMFLGDAILCRYGHLHSTILLRILDVTKIGWIVLGCEDIKLKPFQIY